MTNNWFQSWQPPTGLIPDQQPFHGPFHTGNFSSVYDFGYPQIQKNPSVSRPDTILPYLLSLSIVNPSQQKTSRIEQVNLEKTGPFTTWYSWSVLDFAYPSEYERDQAIFNGDFIPKNNLPLGVEVFGERLFLTMPKWKPGVPATLAVLPRNPREQSPKLVPYPNWEWHQTGSCDGITSVFRIQADSCGRLWVLDSGQTEVTIKAKQICPPKVLIFDLRTDQLLARYVLPDEFIKQDGLYSNIVVDVRGNDCGDAHAYLADVWRFGIVVFSLRKNRAWRITDHLFYPDPLASAYKVHNLEFEWTDGIFGMTLSPYQRIDEERLLLFHPMSSFREFSVKTSVIRNETGWSEVKGAFEVLGQSRGKSGQVSASAMDRRGVMFFNMVTRDTVGCWDSRKLYKRDNLGVVAQSSETLVFPNDLKIDQEQRQSVWVISNRLPFYLYESLDENSINFRIMSAYVDEAVQNTICDPNVRDYLSYQGYHDYEDCY